MGMSTPTGRRPWIVCGAVSGLSLMLALGLQGSADAAAQALPPELARTLALHPREARTQLPDGAWLVLERDGAALKLVEDRVGGRTLRRWPLASPRRYASLSLLPSGRALLWGGVDGNNRLQPGGLWFDPAARSLTSAFDVPLSPRAGHAASVLSDGRLLLTGGWAPTPDAGARAQLWDERSGAAAAGAQAPARLGHRSRVEADGRVRLSEGIDGQGRAQVREQLYDPAQAAFVAADPQRGDAAAAPGLSDSSPRHQARDVAADARLSLRFSQPLRADELNAGNVTLLGPRGFSAVQITPAEAGRLLFVTPRQRLQANAQYSLLVDGAHARDGRPLAPVLIDFATAAERGARADADAAAPRTPKASAAALAPASAAPPRRAAVSSARTTAAAAPAPLSVTLTPEATPSTIATQPDQPVKLSFTLLTPAAEGDYGIGLSNLSITGSSEPLIATTPPLPGRPPVAVSCAPANGGCGIDLAGLTRGSYTVTLQPPAGASVSFKAGLSRDRAYSAQISGANTAVSIVRRGQNARVSFDAAANTVLGVRVSAQSVEPPGREVNYSVIAPNGSVLQRKTVSLRDGLMRQTLPAAGRYSVLVDPRYGELANATVTLGPSNMIEADGDALVRANLISPSILTFESDGRSDLGLGLSGLSVLDGASLVLSVNGLAQATTCYVSRGSCDLNLPKPPAGVHVADVRLSSGGRGPYGYTATLSRPKTVLLSADQATDIAIDRPGQVARLEFDATAAQVVRLDIAAPVVAPQWAGALIYTLYSPTGAIVRTVAANGAQSFTVDNAAAGRYALTIDAPYGETWSSRASLGDPYTNSPIDSGEVELRTQAAGMKATLHFANPSLADIGLGITGVSLSGTTGPIQFKLKNAQGQQVAALDCTPSAGADACELDLPALARGEYDLEATPPAAATAMRALLSFSKDVVATLSPAQPLNLQIPRRGQNARIAVDAQAGATLNLGVSAQLTDPAGQLVAYAVRAPDGNVLAQNSVGANGVGGISVRNLPASGRYEVFVDPAQAAAVSAQLAIIDDFSADLVADADPFALRTQLTGQVVRLNFQAAQGARLGLGIDQLDGVSIPPMVRVRNATGALIAAKSCDTLYGSCALDLDGIDAGAYAVEIEPAASQPPYSARVTLSSDQEHSLAFAQPLALNLERWGQNARLWFQGEAGQHMSLAISGHSHQGQPPGPLPAHRFRYTVYGPDGGIVSMGESEGDQFLNFGPLAQTGAHYLRVDPLLGDAMSAQVRLDLNPDFGLLEIDGAALRMSTQYPGQKLRFAFDVGAADSALSLDVAAVAPVQGPGFELRVMRAGMPSIEIECGEQALGCTLPLNALAPGRYEAAVSSTDPGAPQQFAIDATLSALHRGDLVLQQPYPLQLRSGQPAQLRLSGSAGQRLTVSASGQATTPANANVAYLLRKPDGSVLDAFQSLEAAFARPLPALPADGDYRVEVTTAPGISVQTQLRVDPTP